MELDFLDLGPHLSDTDFVVGKLWIRVDVRLSRKTLIGFVVVDVPYAVGVFRKPVDVADHVNVILRIQIESNLLFELDGD